MEITWKYVKPIKDRNAIEAFESNHRITIPEDLKEIMFRYNGGRPSKKYFDTESGRKHEFKSLLSFNADDAEPIEVCTQLDSQYDNMIPFASDPADNLFCLYKDAIYYWHHETDSVEYLADTFTEFMDKLYSL